MLFFISCIAPLVSLIHLSQAAVTLYAVERPQETDEITLSVTAEGTSFPPSAIGVNEDGATTYVVEFINSLYAVEGIDGGESITVNSVPQTKLQTWVEDANGYTLSLEPSGIWNGVHEVCEFDVDGRTGRCVEEEVISNANIENTFATYTSTYSGRLMGWYTIGGDAPLPAETGGPDSSESEEDSDNAAVGLNVLRGGRVAVLSLAVGACVWLGM